MLQEDGIKKISLPEFSGADIRVGRILDAKDHEGAKKPMYVLSVGFGSEIGTRQIVAGIKEAYAKEELLGKKIICLVNLEPKMIAGIESEGMVLAAESGGVVSLLVPDKDLEEGSKVR
jgi:export-related chaperone CsaA